MSESHIACVARNGVVVIANKCPPGMVPVAVSNNRARLETAICRASRRVRGNDVVVPGLRLQTSDEEANLLVVDFQEEVLGQFEHGPGSLCWRRRPWA